MNKDQKKARIVGILYIIGTLAGILSVVFTGSMRESDYLTTVSANSTQFIIGALFVLVMGLALAMIPPVIFPVFKKHNQTLAIGYIVFRSALEMSTYVATVLNMFLFLTLSQSFISATAQDAGFYPIIGNLLHGADAWINYIRVIIFGISALFINIILYQSKLIPRWISLWGLFGAALHMTNGLLGIFGLIESMSTLSTILDMPIGLQEMVFAIWLIVKGFNPAAATKEVN